MVLIKLSIWVWELLGDGLEIFNRNSSLFGRRDG